MESWHIDRQDRSFVFKFQRGAADEFDAIHPKVLVGSRDGQLVNVKVLIRPLIHEQFGPIEVALAEAPLLKGSWQEIFRILVETDGGDHPERSHIPPSRPSPRPLDRTRPPRDRRPDGARHLDAERPPRRPRLVHDPSDTWLLAGRPIHDVTDQVRRYCGLSWSGGEPETFAFRYYDALPHEPGAPAGPLDLVTCVALQPTITPKELAWFFDEGFEHVDRWVEDLPVTVDLAHANEMLVEHLTTLGQITNAVPLALLSKVAHRLRPRLIPLYEGTVGAHYRQLTGARGESSWRRLVPEIANDLRVNEHQIYRTLDQIGGELGPLTPSPLRLLDIALFMENRPFVESRRRR